MRTLVGGCGLALLLAVAPGSAGARSIGAGEAPTAIVDPAGIAYVAYNGVNGDVMACAVPGSGPFACAPHTVIADGENAEAQPPLLAAPAPHVLEMVSARGPNNQVFYGSSDGARAFVREGPIGPGDYFAGAIGPDGEVVTDIFELGFEVSVGSVAAPAPPVTGPVGTVGNSTLLARSGAGEQVAAWAGHTPIAIRSNATQGTYAYTFDGGSVLDPRDWKRQRIGDTNDLAIASGPHGIYVLQQPFLSDRLSLTHRGRRGRFSRQRLAPRSIYAANVGGVALAQDGKGRLIAAWYTSFGDELVAAVSPDGVHWTQSRVLARHVPLVGRMSMAVGAHGDGVLTWERTGGQGVSGLRVSIPSFLPKPHH